MWALGSFTAGFSKSSRESYTYLSKVRVSNRPFGLWINNNYALQDLRIKENTKIGVPSDLSTFINAVFTSSLQWGEGVHTGQSWAGAHRIILRGQKYTQDSAFKQLGNQPVLSPQNWEPQTSSQVGRGDVACLHVPGGRRKRQVLAGGLFRHLVLYPKPLSLGLRSRSLHSHVRPQGRKRKATPACWPGTA